MGNDAFTGLGFGRGEGYTVRRTSLGGAKRGRQGRRRSMSFFAQITDPQLADEMSPARVDFIDPAGGSVSASHRPQEALGPYVFDQIIRNINRNRTSRVRNGNGKRARLGWAITTGDLADNQQKNETQWIVDILDGKRIDPFSGKPISSSNPCGGSAEQTARPNSDVANRRYTGVQDYSDYPSAPPSRFRGFWDPSRGIDGSPYSSFPRYPGLLERAQQPFQAEGLAVPWYTSRGHPRRPHPGQRARDAGAVLHHRHRLPEGLPVCHLRSGLGQGPDRRAGARAPGRPRVPEHPAGRRRAHAARPRPQVRHQAGVQGAARPRRQGSRVRQGVSLGARCLGGNASYYAYTPRKRQRFISLDTVGEGGTQYGNIDEPQYRWLERELDASSSYEVTRSGQVVRDGDPDRFIVLYGHHTLATMINERSDEEAGSCADASDPATNPGCDRDPRTSTPMHRGLRGNESLRDLLLRFPNAISYVTGHTHRNDLKPWVRRDRRGGFWEINTASHVDWPQQSRLVDMVDNRDGTLSLFGTVLNSAAPLVPPTPGASPSQVSAFSNGNLASISRVLAFNDPQRNSTSDGDGAGAKEDRNAEMILRDPRRRFWR